MKAEIKEKFGKLYSSYRALNPGPRQYKWKLCVMLCYVIAYLVSLQRTFCPLRSTNYSKSYTRTIAIAIIAEGKLGLKQLAQCYNCAPRNNPSRRPCALLSEFHLINAPHISVTQSLIAVYVAGKQ